MESAEQLYMAYKPLLFSLAYRMLGSFMDAEDIVQEVFLSLNKVETQQIRNIRSYLCKMVTNRCMDILRSPGKQREVYVGPWLPEPLVTEESDRHDPFHSYLTKESITTAYLLLLQQLSSVERAVFLLREVLQYEYDEIAEIVGKSSTNCRQIFHRAKRSIGSYPELHAEGVKAGGHEQSSMLVEQFVRALTSGDAGKLMTILSADATLYSDGGGKATAALRPIEGADRITRFLAGVMGKISAGFSFKMVTINGLPGIVTYENGKTSSVVSFDVKGSHIERVYIVVNPDKLTHVR